MEKLNIPRLVLLFLLLSLTPVWAVNPNRQITQYAHTAWRVQDGIEVATAVTQTPDGYLWFATTTGLLRFDGVKFVPYNLPPITPAVRDFNFLLGGRDGSLWIGTRNGLARLKDDKLQWYSDPAQHTGITVILEDPEGTIWLTRYHIPQGEGPLCRVEGNGLHCYGEADGIPVKYGLGLARDSEGNLWFGSSALCRWRPGSSASLYLNEIGKRPDAGDGVVDVAAGLSGTIWASTEIAAPGMGIFSSSGGKWATYVVPGFDGSKVGSHTLFMDREHSLWIGTMMDGLYRVYNGIAEHYGTADGLSGRAIELVYEDHEGNLWVVTDGGIDRFRDTAVVTYSEREGLSDVLVQSVLGLEDGSLWIANGRTIDVFKDGQHSVLPAKGEFDESVMALFEDRKGIVWIGRQNKLFDYEHGRFREFKRPDGSKLEEGAIVAVTEDSKANIWVLTYHHHVFRVEHGAARLVLTASGDSRVSGGLAPDHEGGIWIETRSDTLTHYKDGSAQTISMNRPDSSFSVLEIIVDSDDALLVATTDGLFRWDNERWQVLDSHNGLPSNFVYSVLRDNDGTVWVRCQNGLARISATEFDKWRHQSDSKLVMDVFGRFDGARPGRGSFFIQPPATKTTDGRLWFVAGAVVQMIDPRQTLQNRILPPVHIEEVVADRKSYSPRPGLRLPRLSRDLEIDYSALSFVAPQKVRFRYKLEGRDEGWQEPGTRRQAFYSDLHPGNYRFRVMACNNDGVWNEEGAILDFSIAPAWFQTTSFRLLCVVVGAVVAWVIYRLRVQQIAKVISARFDVRLAERTRMARELHDTFLQTIQGSKLVADDALDPSTDLVRMRHAMEQLSVWLEQAMREGRAALNSLRTSTIQKNDLAEAFRRATENGLMPRSMQATFSVVGDAKEMHPIVRDEVYRIGYEAISNAYRHSQASRLDVELRYTQDLALRVRDNGVGIDPSTATLGKDGHFGLRGMRERATRVGGKLTLVSSVNSGTDITVIVPGDIVFQKKNTTPLEKLKALLRRMGRTPKTDHPVR
jgi:signal transduction histidine kinase/ligand-binding sensor domain-containing protein